MPIIIQTSEDSPLTQGDILQNVHLFSTHQIGAENCGEFLKTKHELCLVLSRPCNATHKKSVVVAAIDDYKGSDSDFPIEYDEVLDFLTAIRDGRHSPDQFYLGHLPGRSSRHAARFDSLHTIAIPIDSTERIEFLKQHRIATLSEAFCKDLHLRFSNAFAMLGFDDYEWPSTEDLKWIASSARTKLSSLEQKLHEVKQEIAQRLAAGTKKPRKEEELARQKENLERKLSEHSQVVRKYEQILERRVHT